VTSHIDFLAIGHVTKDLVSTGAYVVGGTATYAAVTAQRLGLSAGVLTSASPDVDLGSAVPGVQTVVVPSVVSTTFRNEYKDGRRTQHIHGVATSLQPEALPPEWRDVPIVLLGPLAGEMGAEWAHVFPTAIVGAVPQGWMRQWDAEGRVSPKPWREAPDMLPFISVLVLSEDDVGRDEALIQSYVRQVGIAVVTRGQAGATAYWKGTRRDLPAFVVQEVDPTGAGDVFATAFLIRLHETGDAFQAAAFANCAASFAIEGQGTSTIPGRSQVLERLASGRKHPLRGQSHE
jgi:sugar/nucleoside kinase (ribokinase family)